MPRASYGSSLESVIGMCTEALCSAHTGVLIKSLARPGRRQATVTEDFDFHISYL
jgi:hypothetical protein